MTATRALGLATLTLLASVLGCASLGPVQTSTFIAPGSSADHARVMLHSAVGSLDLRGGGEALVAVEVRSNIRESPSCSSVVSDGVLSFELESDGAAGFAIGDTENHWQVTLGSRVPVDLKVDVGVGEAHLDLRQVALRTLDLDIGIGEAVVNLARNFGWDVDVNLECGIGEVRLIVPSSMGIQLEGGVGLGDFGSDSLVQHGNYYRSPDFESFSSVMRIHAETGIGELRIAMQQEAAPEEVRHELPTDTTPVVVSTPSAGPLVRPVHTAPSSAP